MQNRFILQKQTHSNCRLIFDDRVINLQHEVERKVLKNHTTYVTSMMDKHKWRHWCISHILCLPQTPCPNQRTGLTAIRNAATVLSNIFLYLVAWFFLGSKEGGEADRIGPEDDAAFRNIVLVRGRPYEVTLFWTFFYLLHRHVFLVIRLKNCHYKILEPLSLWSWRHS